MNARLEKNFLLLETDRLELMKTLSGLTEAQLERTPRAGAWSIKQIVAHLITSEHLSLMYMKKKSLGMETLDESGLIESLKMITLKISQRFPFKFKAPKVVVEHTPADNSFEELKNNWAASRTQLKAFLETIADHHIKKKIYKHPVAGRIDFVQAIIFFREHFKHHYPQIKRLL